MRALSPRRRLSLLVLVAPAFAACASGSAQLRSEKDSCSSLVEKQACAPGEDCVRLPFIPFKQDGGETAVVRVWRQAGELPRERPSEGPCVTQE